MNLNPKLVENFNTQEWQISIHKKETMTFMLIHSFDMHIYSCKVYLHYAYDTALNQKLLSLGFKNLFKVRKSVHHHTIQINQPTRCNSFTSLLLDVCVWLNMFRAPLRPSSGAYNCTRSLWFYCWRVVASRPAQPRTQHGYHHNTKVKPEAATAVIELLIMGGKTPKTC
jgi:hypothetical protein